MARFRPSYPHVVSTLALIVALSGTAYAAVPRGSVGTPQIKKNAVTAAKIKAGAVRSADVKDGSLLGRDLDESVYAVIAANAQIRADEAIAAALPEARNLVHVTTEDSTIQNVGPAFATVADISFPEAGTYLVTGTLRAFPRQVNPGVKLFCNIAPGITLTNVDVDGGVHMVPFSGLVSTSAADQRVECRQGLGAGEITLSYSISSVRVGDR